MKKAIFILMGSLFLVSCAPNISGRVYAPGETGQAARTETGRVISVRPVKVEGTESGLGAGSGAVAGGVAGSMVGKGNKTKTIGTVAGGLAGGLIGAKMEKAVTTQEGAEYVIEKGNGEVISVVQAADERIEAGERVLIIYGDQIRVVPYRPEEKMP